MKVVTSLQMRKIDKKAISDYGIPSLKLMENAGRKVSEAAMKIVKKSSLVCVCCGGGNNGGDGLVAARYLAKQGYKVKVAIFSPPPAPDKGGRAGKLSDDTSINFKAAEKAGISCFSIDNKRALAQYKKTILSSDLIIDALMGTGLKGEAKGFLREVISLVNSTGSSVLSIDCPSGLAADIELNLDNCIKASATVTLALPKKDLVVYPGAKFVGSLYVADIGIPKKLLDKEKIAVSLIDSTLILPWLELPREPDAHKGDFGHVFIVAGSRNTQGASVLAAKGALRSGAGLVTLGIPESIHPIVAAQLAESMTLPLSENKDGTLSVKSEEKILKFIADKADILAIGPGVSLNKETGKLVKNILMKVRKPVVVDADGLTHISSSINILKKRKAPTVITPHPGEMGWLTRLPFGCGQAKLNPKEINKKRVEVVEKFSSEYKIYTVLKGASTVISSPTGEIFINATGNSAMSSGGMGDVLTGLISGYIAQKFSPLQASILGVYLHGLAGDYLREKMGDKGILASDLADVVPLVSKKIVKKELTDKFFLI